MIKTLKMHSPHWRIPLFSLFLSFFVTPTMQECEKTAWQTSWMQLLEGFACQKQSDLQQETCFMRQTQWDTACMVQIRGSRKNRRWSLIRCLHDNQNPEKSRVQITRSEFRLTYIQQNCPDTSTVVNRVNAVLIFLHFNG